DAAHVVSACGMTRHDLVRRKPTMFRDRFQIESEFRVVTDRYLDQARFGHRCRSASSFPQGNSNRLTGGSEVLRRLKTHRDTGEGRRDIADAWNIGRFEFTHRGEHRA